MEGKRDGDEKGAIRRCGRRGARNRSSDHRCKSCNERMQTRPGYFVPEPGDEDLSPMMLDCKYHVPFEGTVFPLRPNPDPEMLAETRQRKKTIRRW